MAIVNAAVGMLLRSPLHGVLSGSTALIRHTGRRSGRTITTPTQYAPSGEGIVIFVGKWDTKSWWRNFRTPYDADVLVRGQWLPVTAEAVIGGDDPARAASLLGDYSVTFPRVLKGLGEGTLVKQALRAVLVKCVPR